MIYSILDVSMAHIKPSTDEWLYTNPNSIISYAKDFGWFIHTADTESYEDRDIPSDLVTVMNYSREQGCTWLVLDRDGEELDELSVYLWD